MRLLRIIRQKYISAQSKNGVKFAEAAKYWTFHKSSLIHKKNKIQDKSIAYPGYFTQPIHTYENGHLNWEQAYETTCHMQLSALLSVQDITGDPSFQCTPSEAYTIYKSHIVDNIQNALEGIEVRDMADLGCGTGEITQILSLKYPDAYIAGVDLSPNYLAIAMTKYKDRNIHWIHANMEYTSFSTDSFDVVIICYAFHEMIPEAIKGTIAEAYRLLHRNGKLVIIDMDSELLPPFPSFIDVSEPHLKKYRNVRLLDLLCDTGFIKYKRMKLHQLSSLFVGTKP